MNKKRKTPAQKKKTSSKGLRAARIIAKPGNKPAEAFDSCGRLKKGYNYIKGGTVVKADPNKKPARKRKK